MTPEKELLEELQRDLPSAGTGLEVQPSSAEYFVVLQERFPVYGSKLDWDNVPGARIERIDTADSESYFERAVNFANEVWAAERLDREQPVVVIGDSAMEVALKMPLHALQSCLRKHLGDAATQLRARTGCFMVYGFLDGGGRELCPRPPDDAVT